MRNSMTRQPEPLSFAHWRCLQPNYPHRVQVLETQQAADKDFTMHPRANPAQRRRMRVTLMPHVVKDEVDKRATIANPNPNPNWRLTRGLRSRLALRPCILWAFARIYEGP